jgi:hypothetical protein
MDLAATWPVSQSLHLAHVSIVKVLNPVNFGEDIISVFTSNFNLFEKILVLDEQVVKFRVVLF